MGSGMPGPQNFQGAAQQQAGADRANVDRQTQQNRINQSSPFASVTYGADGSQTTSFNGPLAGLNNSLQQQAASAMGTPFSLDGLPGLTNGEQARQQAIDAAYGDASKRLDPQFQQQEEQLRARLAGQGLQEGSQAYNDALANFGRQKQDAYGSAMNSAIGQGTAAGNALFNQSLAARQNGLAEMLRQRGQAFGELQGLQGLTGQQGYALAGRAEAPQFLQAAGMQDASDFRNYAFQQQQIADYINGGVQLAGSLVPFAL